MSKFKSFFDLSSISKNGLYVMAISMILTAIGLFMVYSASYYWAMDKYGDPYYFFMRQGLFAAIGLVLMFLALKIDLTILKKKANLLLLIFMILLVLVAIPGIGIVRGGSRSWFGIGSFAIQPSEIFKIAIIVFTASMFEKYYHQTKSFYKVVIPILVPSFVGFGLFMLQPDLGSGVVMLLAIIIMSLASKCKFKNYILFGVGGVMMFTLLIMTKPYRLNRITAFINPWDDPLGSGFQIIQSLYAIGPGGLLGVGFQDSIQKHFYLPEPQTDFIFAILAEEMGLIGGSIIILLFGLLIYYGFKVIEQAKSTFAAFLGLGVLSLISVQTIINLGVVVGLFPVTGITLPFISYGGSSLTITMFSVGLLAICDRGDIT